MNHASNTGRHRILVIANETAEGNRLHDTVCALAPAAEVLVISPALNSRIRHWVSDEDGARRAAARRLEASVQRLRRAGLDARGDIGDADPLQAIRDALSTFAADEIVISTHPKGRSNWL